MSATPRSLPLGEIPIFGRTNAQQPAVLAMHGWQRTAHDFDWLLATEIPTVAIDLPAFGQTKLPSSEWGTPEYADAVADALDTRGWKNMVLAGHSFGGRVAVRLAAKRPDLVAGLVITGSPLIRPDDAPKSKPALAFRVAKMLNKIKVLPDSLMEKQRQKYGSTDYRTAGPALRPVFVRIVNDNYDDDLRAVGEQHKPVALVWGRNDTEAPAAQVDKLAEVLGATHVVVGEATGHDTVNEMRDELQAAITIILKDAG
ncbi:pimeloyl-ACP methyl ester carboxylesterase [Antricoccus suffuscus]|uniref:Pimeloyl-ACP methyl ester carboxylesterase n=1 Tax=Antricoccus suffuscus TaxID=1629062 RepID=A0A2T1A1C6_9ACTN|nr:alpha/beta hydrolase [Antricoccus suffuscus]PRZ42393.1 pimeloyl-ACP methyl ester carboxylesterase [Antricoccus suffuscus]